MWREMVITVLLRGCKSYKGFNSSSETTWMTNIWIFSFGKAYILNIENFLFLFLNPTSWFGHMIQNPWPDPT